jgi:peptidoglycan/LPS O-acetylase OafA/YrhL
MGRIVAACPALASGALSCVWRTSSDLWTWKIGLPTGAVFGAFALSAIYLMGAGVRDSPTGLMGAWLLGGAYGLATAAITSRRKITNEC